MRTGFWGVPGKIGGKVHIEHHGRPLCGSFMDPSAEFQFCANSVRLDLVECGHCRKRPLPIGSDEGSGK